MGNKIIFDRVEAESLLRSMNEYCGGIQSEMIALLRLMDYPAEWRDGQQRSFQENLREIARELNGVLKLESDNMNIFYKRVMELRG